MATRKDIQAKFEAFHSRKPWVYEKFCETCDLLISKGIRHSSSTMILEYVKMAHLLQTGEHVSLPNDFRAYYAKKWRDEHKEGKPWRFLKMNPSRAQRENSLRVARSLVPAKSRATYHDDVDGDSSF